MGVFISVIIRKVPEKLLVESNYFYPITFIKPVNDETSAIFLLGTISP